MKRILSIIIIIVMVVGILGVTLTNALADGQETPVLYGDVNGDGEVDDRDLLRLWQYLTGWKVEIFPGADVNGDGVVDDKDLLRLLQYLNNRKVIDDWPLG